MFSLPNTPILSFDQANPVLTGGKLAAHIANIMANTRGQQLNNIITQAKANLAPQMTKADLIRSQATELPNDYISFLLQKQMFDQMNAQQNAQQNSGNYPSGISPVVQTQGAGLPGQNTDQGNTTPAAFAKYTMTAQQIAQAQAQAAEAAKANQDWINEANSMSQSAIKAQQDLSQYNTSLDKVKDLKGPIGGNVPVGKKGGILANIASAIFPDAEISNRQQADIGSSNLVNDVVPLQGLPGNKWTNLEMHNIAEGKPTAILTDAARKEVTGKQGNLFQRAAEYPQFVKEAMERGYDANNGRPLWNQYNQEYPVLDNKTGEPLPKNIGQYSKFFDSLNKSSRKSSKSIPLLDKNSAEVQVAQLANQLNGGKNIQASKTLNGKNYQKIDGRWYEV